MSEKLTLIVCPYCGVGCRLYIKSVDGYPVGIEYATDLDGIPNEKGKLCPKANAVIEYLTSRDRLRKPLKAVEEGKFREISWKEAIKEVSERLLEIKKQYGPDAVMFFGSARTFNEPNYLIQKLARVYGTNNVDHCARLCHSATVAGLKAVFGAGAMTNTYRDIAMADCIIVWGHNYAETHPVGFRYVLKAKDRGAKLIVVDPRRTRTAWFADIHLQLYPGTDIALANAMIHVIIKENLYDKEFVAKRTVGFDDLVKTVEKYTPEYAEKITGVPASLIREAARMFARAEKGVITWCMGLTQHTCGTDNVRLLATLAAICGHVGREGTGCSPMRGQNNVQGACDLGVLPNVFPGYKSVTASENIEYFKKHWGVDYLSDKPGYTIIESSYAIEEGKVKAYYIMGENPVISDANSNHVVKALKKLEFLVVQDIFLTETAQFADIVLPAAALPENEGSLTNTERRVQWSFKAVEPPGEARPDWWIITEIAKAMGYEKQFPYTSVEEITLEIARVVPQYGGMTPERLKNNIAGIHWPCPSPDHPGTPILYKDKFLTPDGKAHLAAVEHRPPAEQPDDEYPFILTTVRVVGMYHTNTMTGRSPSLKKRWPEPYLEIHPDDAEKLGIKTGDKVKIITRRGEYVCKAKVTMTIKPGVVAVPWHWGANVLTNDALDPISKIPETKVCACKIIRLEG
ncbi:formate dehydrogenase subunit alpha [Desulfurococcaceae archaeon MEX13E-LK6-19]|nr:formate dehydrogenase subunit alpha [Desulfurococcaceae archaeon MEX13E-LK6-19]